jgi:hypothetical protein
MMTMAVGTGVQGAFQRPLAAVATSTNAAASSKSTASTSSGLAARETPASARTTLSAEAQRQVAELAVIDRQVRAHEQAHMSVGRDLVRSAASYDYQQGPDGRRYAVAGEVSIDSSPAGTAEATIPKAAHIRATALAPADPSAQDRSVAAAAAQMEGQARQEVALSKSEGSASGASAGAAAYAALGSDSTRESAASVDVFA